MLFNLRFRKFPGGMQSGLIEASSLEAARQVGERWCEMETERLATFTPVKLIGVEPALLADEGILKLERPAPLPAEKPIELVPMQEQLRRIEARNLEARALPQEAEAPAPVLQAAKPSSAWDKLKSLGREA